MKRLLVVLPWAFLAAACERPRHPSPYVPPETQYSAGSTISAAGGVMAAAVGAHMTDPDRSAKTRAAGTAVAAAGMGLLLGSLIDAVEVQQEREKFMKLTNAFWRHYLGSPPPPESAFRDPLPALPEVPFDFSESDSPLAPGGQP